MTKDTAMMSNRRHVIESLNTMVHEGNVRIQEATMQRRLLDISEINARLDAIVAEVAPLIAAVKHGTATVAMMERGAALKNEKNELVSRLEKLAA